MRRVIIAGVIKPTPAEFQREYDRPASTRCVAVMSVRYLLGNRRAVDVYDLYRDEGGVRSWEFFSRLLR